MMNNGPAQTKPELLVFISSKDSRCDECGQDLGSHAWITLKENKGALCLTCADLDHLAFLPSGDAALTRRAKKHSKLSAVVLKWSRARKRYERQGLLVENEAIDQAEKECEADASQREIRRAQSAIRRGEIDQKFVRDFAAQVRAHYPGAPKGRENIIAEHACRKYSGRVGRSEMAKQLDIKAVRLAVRAHIRHTETTYDDLLSGGHDRFSARDEVSAKVDLVEHQWRQGIS